MEGGGVYDQGAGAIEMFWGGLVLSIFIYVGVCAKKRLLKVRFFL